jgi:CBS domain containing-hemolysin-like protein
MTDPSHSLSASTVALQLLLVLALVLLNGFFVASEFALVSVRKTRIDQLAAEGNSSAAAVQRALRDINRYIAATQVGITVASLVLGGLGEKTLEPLISHPLSLIMPEAVIGVSRVAVATALAYLVMTFFHVIIGELLPKSYTLQKAEAVAMMVSRPMGLFVRLSTPLVWVLHGTGTFLLRRMGIHTSGGHAQVHSPEELDLLFTQSHEGGQLSQTERDLLHRVVKFSDLTAREVMMPRVEMQAIPHEMERDEFFAFLNGAQTVVRNSSGDGNGSSSTPHTRTPVYRESMDEIVGIAHLKDLVRYAELLRAEQNTARVNLMKVTREAVRVPETITIDKLLVEFQKHRQQMAIVIDEYGGTSGLITMGDLLAQVFGDVHDEFDKPVPEIVEQQAGTIDLAGRVLIDEVNERFDTGFRCDDADTIAGLVLNKLGRPAVIGDEVEINRVRLRVLELDRLRIMRLQMRLPQDSQ